MKNKQRVWQNLLLFLSSFAIFLASTPSLRTLADVIAIDENSYTSTGIGLLAVILIIVFCVIVIAVTTILLVIFFKKKSKDKPAVDDKK